MRIYTGQPWLYIQPLHELFAGRRNAAWPVGVAGLLLLPYTNLLGSYYSCFNLDKSYGPAGAILRGLFVWVAHSHVAAYYACAYIPASPGSTCNL